MNGSEESTQRELLWLEHPFKELGRLAWPIAISTLSYSAMTLVDTYFVAGVSPAALAGVGLGGITAFTLLCFSIGLLRGVKVLTSQAVGAGRDNAAVYVGAGMGIALVLGTLTLVAGELVAPLIGRLAATAEAGHYATVYLQVRILSAPALLVFVAVREYSYGRGDARTPMVASVTGNVVNICLDYILIEHWHQAAVGAAASSVFANVVEMSILVAAVRGRGLLRRPSLGGRYVRSVLAVGMPTGVQFLLEVGSFSLLSVMIAGMAEAQMAAHQIVLHTIHFSFLPAWSLAEAGSVMAGQAVGARRDDLVIGVAVRAMLVAALYTGACTLVLLCFGGQLVGVFTKDPQVTAVAIRLATVAAIFQVADGAAVIARGVLRGTGDVKRPAIIGICTAWLCVPPLTWLFGFHLHMGATGGWIGLCVEICVGATLFWARLLGNRWRREAARSRVLLG